MLRLALLLMLTLCLPGRILAGEPPRAGLVVQTGDGRVLTRCVALAAEEVSGYDLLLSSGLEIVLDPSSGLGVLVCQIEGEGCAYPHEPCFCSCSGGGTCTYWNYFYRDPQAVDWGYSAMGAMMRKVRNGAVEAWVWGNGQTPPAAALTFESICAAPTATAGPASPPSPTVASTAAAATAEPVAPAPTIAALPSEAPPTAGALPEQGVRSAPAILSYWPFGLMILALLLIGVVVLRRRG